MKPLTLSVLIVVSFLACKKENRVIKQEVNVSDTTSDQPTKPSQQNYIPPRLGYDYNCNYLGTTYGC